MENLMQMSNQELIGIICDADAGILLRTAAEFELNCRNKSFIKEI